MISQASVKFVRIAPRKVRYVIDLIRKKRVNQAQAILHGSPRRASGILQKLLGQALDAAQRNSQVSAADLMVSKVLADGGPIMKRFRAASMGRASSIKKRTSHIYLELDLVKQHQEHGAALKPKAKTAAPPVAAPAATAKKRGVKTLNKKTVGAK